MSIGLDLEVSLIKGTNKAFDLDFFQVIYLWCLLMQLGDKYLGFVYFYLA